MKRQRGRGRRPISGNRAYESNGPDVKIRGTASQIHDKYIQYARDAQTSGDRIRAENFLQHAEHYFRMMAMSMPPRSALADQAGGEDGEDGGSVQQRQDGPYRRRPQRRVGESVGSGDSRGEGREGHRVPRRISPGLGQAVPGDEQTEQPRIRRSALDTLAEEQATVTDN